MDWKNQLHMIQNKVKTQLHARKVDDLESVRKLIEVPLLFFSHFSNNPRNSISIEMEY